MCVILNVGPCVLIRIFVQRNICLFVSEGCIGMNICVCYLCKCVCICSVKMKSNRKKSSPKKILD